MTLRGRLLLAQLPLIVALGATAIVAAARAPVLGRNPALILKDNYRSVVAAHTMKDALSQIERGAIRPIREVARAEEELSRGITSFEEGLQAEESNLTEHGETQATQALRASWQRYRDRLRSSPGASEPSEAGELAALADVKESVERILAINQDAMKLKSAQAQDAAERLGTFVVLASVLACLLGVAASFLLTSRLLRPLSVLSLAARRLGQGDLLARARVDRPDEIGALAREFNTMADRLVQFRNSSLGELLEVERQTQAAIDSLPDPVLILDLRGGLLTANRAAESILHIAVSTHAEEESPLSRCPPLVREAIERAHADLVSDNPPRSPAGFEESVQVTTPEGEVFLLPRSSRVLGERGELRGVTITLQDVSRARRFDELKNDLVATVAHEFRTPLTSLRMAVHLCLERAAGPVTEKQLDLLHAARQDTERLQQMVDDLLDLSRLQSGRVVLNQTSLAVEDLVDAALSTWQASAKERAVTLKAEILPGTGTVWADAERLGLVLGNLLGNAIKHSPTGDTVVVRARHEGLRVRMEVIDHGPGIPPEYRALIFEKFFRVPGAAPAAGAGLGLFLAKEITEAHGGRIGVEANPKGTGSVFWLDWPAEAHDPALRESSGNREGAQ